MEEDKPVKYDAQCAACESADVHLVEDIWLVCQKCKNRWVL